MTVLLNASVAAKKTLLLGNLYFPSVNCLSSWKIKTSCYFAASQSSLINMMKTINNGCGLNRISRESHFSNVRLPCRAITVLSRYIEDVTVTSPYPSRAPVLGIDGFPNASETIAFVLPF